MLLMFIRFFIKLIVQVLVAMAKWLVGCILYVYNHECVLRRAECPDPVEHGEQEDRYPVPCTDTAESSDNLVFMQGLLADRYPVPCTDSNNLAWIVGRRGVSCSMYRACGLK